MYRAVHRCEVFRGRERARSRRSPGPCYRAVQAQAGLCLPAGNARAPVSVLRSGRDSRSAAAQCRNQPRADRPQPRPRAGRAPAECRRHSGHGGAGAVWCRGLYLNASNAAQGEARFREFQKWTADSGLRWSGVGLDIEPNLQEFSGIGRAVSSALKRLVDPDAVTRARIAYASFIAQIQAAGYGVETYQFPFLADERAVHSTLLERLFGIVDVRGNREVLMLYSSYNRPADSAVIWQYGPSAQLIATGVTAGDPQPGARVGTLTFEELSHDVIVASHFSPKVGIFDLEGSVRRGFLPKLIALDWSQPVTISADQNRQVIRFRARVQAALWTLSRLPYFALAILRADACFLLRRRRRGALVRTGPP